MDLNTATAAQISARLGELATIIDGWEATPGDVEGSLAALGAAVREVGQICVHRALSTGWRPL